MATIGYFDLPQIPEADFNRLAMECYGAMRWEDADHDGAMDPEELSAKELGALSAYVENNGGKKVFTLLFQGAYLNLLSKFRRELVSKELKLTYMEPAVTNLGDWLRQNIGATDEEITIYRNGVRELIAASGNIQRIFQDQVGFNGSLKFEEISGDDAELIKRYGHPWCMGNQSPLCVAIPSVPDRSINGLFPAGVTCEQAGSDELKTPFSTVAFDESGKLIAVPYSIAFKEEQQTAAEHYREAAAYFDRIPREKAFAEHLRALANALESSEPFPYVEADRTWHAHGASDSVFLFRAGPDEFGDEFGDKCGTKARFHQSIGLVNKTPAKIAEQYKPNLQDMENQFAKLVGNPKLYSPQEVVLQLPQFYDIIHAVGDDIGGPNGTTIGQTLPNQCGADGKEEPCKRRVLIFANKTLRAYNDELVKEYIMPLFDPELTDHFNSEGVGLEVVSLHEILHNFGPQLNKIKPRTTSSYGSLLAPWGGMFEELKAEHGSLFFAGEDLATTRADFEAGKISAEDLALAEEKYKQKAVYHMAWATRMILRATRGGKFEGRIYSKLAAVQVGFLAEAGAITFDRKTKKWKINFEGDKFKHGVDKLMAKLLKLYAEANSKKVGKFVQYYLYGKGFKALHSDRTVEVAGAMPAVLFDYNVEDL